MLGNEIQELRRNIQRSKKSNYLKTGFTSFDNKFKGIPRHDVTLIAARRGMGTTDLCLSIVNRLAKKKAMISDYITFESTRSDLLKRLLSMNARLKISKLNKGISRKSIGKIENKFEKLPITIHDHISPDGDGIANFLFGRIEENKLLVIDSLNQLKFTEEQLADLIKMMRQICSASKCAIILIYHLGDSMDYRGGEKKPMLEDLNQYYFLKSIIDTIIFIYRADYYGIREDENGVSTKRLAELIIAKSHGVKTGTVKLQYLRNYCCFKNI